jgi:hypothetical protein
VGNLRRIVARLRERWPRVAIAIRADEGFAKPTRFDWCEAEGITSTIGLVTNSRLRALAADAQEASDHAAGGKVRLVGKAAYQAKSWPTPRRVVITAEVLPPGPNFRFVVTNRTWAPEPLWHLLAVQHGRP